MKKILSLILVLCMVAVVLPMSVSAADANGTVGSCVWKLEGTKLTISGNGRMGYVNTAPWGTEITEVVVNEGVTEISMGLFEHHTKLEKVTLPSSVKIIDVVAFGHCSSLKSIELPEGLERLGISAFQNCTSLEEIRIPKTVTFIDPGIFINCDSLERIDVDEGSSSFCSVDGVLFNKDMSTLIIYPPNKPGEKYTVPESVTALEHAAFMNNPYLKQVTLHDNITQIGINAFAFTNMYDDKSNHYNGGLYIGKYLIKQIDPALTTFSVREGTLGIAEGAFFVGNVVTRVYIPEGVRYINEIGFACCERLSSVSIPTSLTSIGDGAFSQCSALKKIYYRGSAEDKGKIFVDNDNSQLWSAKWFYNSCLNSDQHSWGEPKVIVVPGCTTEGTLEKECRLCKATSREVGQAAVGHDYSEFVVVTQPTSKMQGTEQQVCKNCGDVVSRSIPSLREQGGGVNVRTVMYVSIIIIIIAAAVILAVIISSAIDQKEKRRRY